MRGDRRAAAGGRLLQHQRRAVGQDGGRLRGEHSHSTYGGEYHYVLLSIVRGGVYHYVLLDIGPRAHTLVRVQRA